MADMMVYEVQRVFTTRDAARLFSSKRLTEVASGNFDFLLKVATHYGDGLREEFTAAEVFECSYSALSKEYRTEYFFKNIVAERLLLGRHSLNTATVLPEFRVGRNKADCVILNGSSTCYEIKSDFDNLDRLPEQLASYKKLFDKVYVVVGQSHLSKVLSSCEEDVGILELTPRKNLRIIREAKISTEPVDISILMRSLRVHEYRDIVSTLSDQNIDLPNTEIFSACESILQKMNSTDVRRAFCATLKKSRKIEKEFISSLPRSLLMAGIGFKLRTDHRRSLAENLNKTFSKDTTCTTQYYEANSLN
ncbi:sce7726 family protein [Pseudomonas sp. CFBP 8758]|uniref:sce7726 family protein n=1 Tax=Pseudomonas sp. CFBP 8758 TaxID=2775286 RepID=UPI0017839141|nr:sce7726 family protein [Pseudomonas sp. CFBP 8758]MBD8593731.1 sce7726 family protein [Pseudomonas sp. CFBP 8758]